MKRSHLEYVNSVKCLRSKSVVVAAVAVMAAAAVTAVVARMAAVAVVASLMVAVVAHAMIVDLVKTVVLAMIVDLVMIAHVKTVPLVVTVISVTVDLAKTVAHAPIALVALAPILVMTHVRPALTSVEALAATHAAAVVPTLVVGAQVAHAVAHLQVATSAQRAVTD